MKISKKDALIWFDFFSQLPKKKQISTKHEEIIYSTFAQIEAAIDHRNDMLMSEISGLKTLENRTFTIILGKTCIFPDLAIFLLSGVGN